MGLGIFSRTIQGLVAAYLFFPKALGIGSRTQTQTYVSMQDYMRLGLGTRPSEGILPGLTLVNSQFLWLIELRIAQ